MAETSTAKSSRKPRILGIDAGGTMTDTFLIDDNGDFVVGKAQTTPHDESIGFINSARDAMQYWGLKVEEGFPQLRTGIFSGTAMLNRLLERKGRRVGILVSGGMEDYLRQERAIQTYLGYSFADRIHLATHHHNEPLVPRERIFGVRGRIDVFGKEAIPLYAGEVRDAVEKLLDMKVEAIVVNFIFCYKNPAHELLAKSIIDDVCVERKTSVPVYLASDLYPTRQDFPRLNTTLMEAYAAEPSRQSLRSVREKVHEAGGKFDLRVMASHGGTISMDAKELARTMVSGPIGGVIGSRYLGKSLGIKNIACSDIGGTSFDIALVTDGEFEIKQNTDIGRFLLNMPLVRIDSIGAGTGSFVRVNPTSGRIEIGPDSAGYRVGMCWPESGLDTVTITDCNVVLGYINPDFFLGGDITLDRQRAIDAVKTRVADKLGIDVYRAAAGVVELFEDSLKNALLGQILGKGYGPESFTALSYGGGGPLHVGGYTDGLAFEDILVPSWAPGFSAFGCACGDYEYRYDFTLDLPLLPTHNAETRNQAAATIREAWARLADQVAAEFAKNGVAREEIKFKPGVRMLYYGQLNALEIPSTTMDVKTGEDLEALKEGFEDVYGRLYGISARTPEFGYLIQGVVMCGSVPVDKPALPMESEVGEKVDASAQKAERDLYYRGAWHKARILDLDNIKAGNVVHGPAVVEAPASTMVVPPGRSARLDKHRIFHMSTNAATKC